MRKIIFQTREEAEKWIEEDGADNAEVVELKDGVFTIHFKKKNYDNPELKRGKDYVEGKAEAKKIARQLCYPQEVIDKLDNAKSEVEITNILKDARLGRI